MVLYDVNSTLLHEIETVGETRSTSSSSNEATADSETKNNLAQLVQHFTSGVYHPFSKASNRKGHKKREREKKLTEVVHFANSLGVDFNCIPMYENETTVFDELVEDPEKLKLWDALCESSEDYHLVSVETEENQDDTDNFLYVPEC